MDPKTLFFLAGPLSYCNSSCLLPYRGVPAQLTSSYCRWDIFARDAMSLWELLTKAGKIWGRSREVQQANCLAGSPTSNNRLRSQEANTGEYNRLANSLYGCRGLTIWEQEEQCNRQGTVKHAALAWEKQAFILLILQTSMSPFRVPLGRNACPGCMHGLREEPLCIKTKPQR